MNVSPPCTEPGSVLIVGPDPEADVGRGGHVADVAVLLDELRSRGIETWVMPGALEPDGRGLAGKIVRGAGRLVTAARTAVTRRPDLVVLLAGPPPSFVEKALIAGVFRVFGVRTLLCPRSGHIARAARAGSAPLRRLLGALAHLPHAIAVQTESWREFYVSELGVNPRRAHVVENWVVTPGLSALAPPEPASGRIGVVYAAALHPDKGIDDVVGMVPFLAPVLREHDAVLTIVGEGPAADAVRELQGAFAPHVAWRPSMPRDEFLRFLATQHVLVAPSKVEGLPNLLIEAACLNVAIVASPAGGVGDVIVSGTTGVLVEPGRPGELAGAVTELVEDTAKRTAIVRASRAEAEARFSAHANVGRLLAAGWPAPSSGPAVG